MKKSTLKNVIIGSVIGYRNNVIKRAVNSIICSIPNYIKSTASEQISLESIDNEQAVYLISQYLITLKPLLKKSVFSKRTWNTVTRRYELFEYISQGRYTILDNDLFIYLNIVKSTVNVDNYPVINMIMNITIFGNRRFDVMNNIKKIIEKTKNDSNCNKNEIIVYGKGIIQYKNKRDFSTIFNPEILDIKNRIDLFISNKSFYEKHMIRYKLNILLYGEPGTGKSSIALAIASYLNWELFIGTDVNSIKKESVVLIEDIDKLFEKKKDEHNIMIENAMRESDYPRLDNEYDLMQFLDSNQSRNNVITIMTTNNFDVINKANIIRPGRFDIIKNIDRIDKETAIQMALSYNTTPEAVGYKDSDYPILPCELQEKLLADNLTKIGLIKDKE